MKSVCVFGFSFLLVIATVAIAVSGELNVMDYGAKADGETNDQPAFVAAFKAATEQGKAIVYAPAGRYRMQAPVIVPAAVTLRGDYQGQGRQKGTILIVDCGKGEEQGTPFMILAGGSQARGLAFEYPEQSADATEPVPFPWTIKGNGDSRIEDIYLHNSYRGINLDGAHANLVRNVWGEPLRVGINVDHCYDISRIENVHFWPYFTLGKPLRNWVQANGVAFQFGRSDWQYCHNVFSFGYHTGFLFYPSQAIEEHNYPGGTTNGNFVGIGADSCVIGIDVQAAFEIGVSIHNGLFAPFAAVETRGVRMQASNNGNLTLTNCNFWAVTSVLAEVNGGSLNMTACNIQEWAIHQPEKPAFVVNGGRLNVSSSSFNKGGYLALLEGEKSRANFMGNMGKDDPFQIVNRIGDRAVITGNNPMVELVDTPPTPPKK